MMETSEKMDPESDMPEGLAAEYILVWRQVLIGWLHWPEQRFAAFVASWDFILRSDEGQRMWFYHENELYDILPLLVPEELADRLAKQRTQQIYNDLAHLEHNEIEPAILGRPQDPTWRTDTFDWEGARCRVVEVLERYGASLPGPSQVTAYETRILADGRLQTAS